MFVNAVWNLKRKKLKKVNLANKKILLGVSGSIAAYKAALLVRLFVKNGAEVQVIMTEDAEEFISPLTLSTLSKKPVHSSFYADKSKGTWVNHVELGLWADLLLIAPATGNTIAKMANGQSDNLLVATYLSARCPVYIAPAMDLDMWAHPSTQANVSRLTEFGNTIIDVEEGELASGLEGKGRLAKPEHILSFIEDELSSDSKKNFKGKQVLITAGPTREDIDPVRFISNHSSGTMGVELANAFAKEGAEVHLVLGPTAKHFYFHKNVTVIPVVSANEMFQAVDTRFDESDITIMAAAVADYTPANQSKEKIKKKEGDLSLQLARTKDILQTMGSRKKAHQILIGFALETNNELENAKRKLQKKNLDLIVLNSMKDKGAGFQHQTNKVTIIDRFQSSTEFELKSKREVARDILLTIQQFPNAQQA